MNLPENQPHILKQAIQLYRDIVLPELLTPENIFNKSNREFNYKEGTREFDISVPTGWFTKKIERKIKNAKKMLGESDSGYFELLVEFWENFRDFQKLEEFVASKSNLASIKGNLIHTLNYKMKRTFFVGEKVYIKDPHNSLSSNTGVIDKFTDECSIDVLLENGNYAEVGFSDVVKLY